MKQLAFSRDKLRIKLAMDTKDDAREADSKVGEIMTNEYHKVAYVTLMLYCERLIYDLNHHSRWYTQVTQHTAQQALNCME